jgi:hypothetical protein
MIRKKTVGILQVFLLVMSIFAIANFTSPVSGNDLLASLGIGSDGENIKTCVEAIDDSACQQFPAEVCDVLCKELCIDGERTGVTECESGVCIDEDQGICSTGATKKNCEDKSGKFVSGTIDDIAECERHCCILGDEAQFVTEKRCKILSDKFEIEENFDANYYSADLCSMFAKEEQMGACAWPSVEEGKNECRFTSLSDCMQNFGGGASFNEGKLCSNSELNTICEKKNNTACVDGLDGVYWFDSCGNKENIFDGSRADKGWNDGEVLPLEESCSVGSGGNPLRNQNSCGNCVRVLSSSCGEEIGRQELDDSPDSGVVCRDLGCDDDGTRRENGETWCEYVSDFGPSMDVPFLGVISNYANIPAGNSMLRAMAAPGSEQYRKSCIDGEITSESCGPYRNGICIESQTEVNGTKPFSTASCIANRWAECLNYNAGGDGVLSQLTNTISQIASIPVIGQAAGKALELPTEAEKFKVLNMMLTCEKDPDCFVKTVSVDKDFKFPMCVPKYPPGFYKKEADQNDAGICAFANQMCSTVWMKESTAFTFGATAHWECKAGCDCITGSTPEEAEPSNKFVNEMQALCVSMGDCGAKVNYIGDVGGALQGYALKKAEYDGLPKEQDENRKKKTVAGTFSLPTDDSRAKNGKYIDAGKYNGADDSSSDSGGSGDGGMVGAPGIPGYRPNSQTTALMIASLSSGGIALGAVAAVHAGYSVVAVTSGFSDVAITSGLTEAGAMSAAATYEGQLAQFPSLAGTEVGIGINPAMIAFQGATIGASIGIAVVSILVGVSGIGRGIGTAGTIGYMVGAGVGGGMAGTSVAMGGWGALTGSSTATTAAPAWLGPVGIAVAVIVIADIIAQWVAGVGDIKTVEVYFECKPWTAPAIPKCEECGKHGVPCNQYNCETLGAECEFIAENEGVEDKDIALCVAVEFNDVSGPKITELLDDSLIEGFEYKNIEGLETESTQWNIEKTRTNDGCVNQFDKVGFGFSLDEAGECRYSFEPDSDFDEMYSLGSGLRYDYRYSLGNLWEQIDSGNENTQDLNVYIKCRDYQIDETRGGNIGGESAMSFCVNPIDITAPFVVGTNVPQGYVAAHDQDNITIIVTFDEIVREARLDFEDLPFEEMQYEMRCSGNICSVEVPVEFGGNKFYVKAIDMNGNEMVEGRPIEFERSESSLEIGSIKYNGENLDGKIITRGNLLNSIEVVVETTGGVDGTADCAYRLNGQEAFFKETGSGKTSTHKQLFTSLVNGNYNLMVSCGDSAGNSASEEVNFAVKTDIDYPKVSRVYDNSGRLTVITDESATCAYTNEDCNFAMSEGVLMDGRDLVHTTSLDRNKTYYIRCTDEHENLPSGCSIVASGGDF